MADRKVTVEVSVEGKNNLGAAAAQASAAAKQAAQQAATSPAATAAAAAAAAASAAANNPFGTKVKPLFSSQTDQNLSRLAQLQSGASSQASLVATAKAAAAAAATSPSVAATAAAAAAASNSASPFGTKVRPLFGAQTNANLANLASLQAQNAGLAGGVAGSTQGPSGLRISNADIFAGFKNSVTGAVEGMQKFQFAALAASAAASAAVAATAPATWATFTGSIQLLSGEFANMLIPAFVSVSAHLQRGAAWVRSWDASTKGFVTTTATWVGGLLLAGGAISKLGALITPVVHGVAMLGVAAARAGVAMAAFAVANPWVAGLVVAVGVVGYLTNGFGLLGDSISRAASRADDARQRIARLQQGGSLQRSDYEAIPPNVRAALESSRDRRATLDLMIGSQETELRRQMQFNPTNLQTQIEAVLSRPRGFFEPEGVIGQRGRQNEITQILMQRGVPAQEARARAVEAVPFRFTGMSQDDIRNAARSASGINAITESTSQLETLRRVREQGIPGLFEGLASSSAFQPRSFSSGDQFYGDVLQQVLGRGTMEQQLFELQMRNLETNQQAVNELRGLRGDVREPNAPR